MRIVLGMDVEGKIVLITGASSGIGLATALAFAKAQSTVVLVSRRGHLLNELAGKINSQGGRAVAITADISDRLAVEELVKGVEKEYGGIDVLVNNAGIGVNNRVLDIKVSDLEQVFAVNFYGPLYLIQVVSPLMMKQAGGCIVNILSINARRTMPKAGGYSASKAALEMLTDSLRMEVATEGIKVINLYPGFTLTPFSQNVLGAKPKGRGRRFAISPDKVGKAVVKAVQKEKRDSYVTLFDKLLVGTAIHFPGLADWAMKRLWG